MAGSPAAEPLAGCLRGPASAGSDIVQQLRRILEQRHEQRITLYDLGAAVDLSPFQTLRIFQRHCGVTPHQYLVRYRVEQATRLIHDGEPIAEVAVHVGFTDQSHMTKHFKKLLGLTPSRYRSTRLAATIDDDPAFGRPTGGRPQDPTISVPEAAP